MELYAQFVNVESLKIDTCLTSVNNLEMDQLLRIVLYNHQQHELFIDSYLFEIKTLQRYIQQKIPRKIKVEMLKKNII